MAKVAVNVLLLIALVLPVALFLLLFSQLRFDGLVAAALSIAAGWALNLAWAFAARGQDRSQANENFPIIATRFGWACPAALVLLTWSVWRFALGHGA